MEGLEAFYLAVQTVRRNRDVIMSLAKGLKSLRPLANFKFVEEEIDPPHVARAKKKKEKEKKITRGIEEIRLVDPEPEPTSEENING